MNFNYVFVSFFNFAFHLTHVNCIKALFQWMKNVKILQYFLFFVPRSNFRLKTVLKFYPNSSQLDSRPHSYWDKPRVTLPSVTTSPGVPRSVMPDSLTQHKSTANFKRGLRNPPTFSLCQAGSKSLADWICLSVKVAEPREISAGNEARSGLYKPEEAWQTEGRGLIWLRAQLKSALFISQHYSLITF